MIPVKSNNKLKKQFAGVKPGDFGIFGDPIEHSLSPGLQNAALQQWWHDSAKATPSPPAYHKFHVKPRELKEALNMAHGLGLRGLNVTVPHKERICDFLNFLDDFAEDAQSVNTVVLNEQGLKGYNTDGFGFEASLKNDLGFDPKGKNVFVLGTGGTGKVILHQLLRSGAGKVFIWNRHSDRAASLIASLKRRFNLVLVQTADETRVALSASDLIVNATSVGLYEADGEPAAHLSYSPAQVYFDVIYHRETRFLQKAKEAGAKAIGGIGMLLYQGARAFEIWTKTAAPVELMRKALDQTLKEKGLIPLWPSDI